MRLVVSSLLLGYAALPAAGQSAVRELPPVYGGNDFTVEVTIVINPPPNTVAVGLEDLPPAGWTIGNISNGGSVDGQTGKVKWGPFFGTFPASVSYEATAPASASGEACFIGTASFDGLDQPITGDACVIGPVPATSSWGLLVLGLGMLVLGTLRKLRLMGLAREA